MIGSPLWFPHYLVDDDAVDKAAGNDPRMGVANVARVPKDAIAEINARKINARLLALRVTSPSLEVIPIPRSRLIVSNSINYVTDVYLPSDAELMMFSAPVDVPYYVSTRGNVNFNGGAGVAANPQLDQWNDPIVSPNKIWFYCHGLKTVSVGIPFINNVISVSVL